MVLSLTVAVVIVPFVSYHCHYPFAIDLNHSVAVVASAMAVGHDAFDQT